MNAHFDLKDDINTHYLLDENQVVAQLLEHIKLNPADYKQISTEASRLVKQVRSQPDNLSPLDRFLTEYDLATEEGVLLMCLAESLLRIPDKDTIDTLIADKLKSAAWDKHTGSKDLLVNASAWGLMITGRLLPDLEDKPSSISQLWSNMIARLSEPVIRTSILLAMRVIGDQFVFGETIQEAIEKANKLKHKHYSFDMLGEAALTTDAADDYLDAYSQAITAISNNEKPAHYAISIKLSALCPRFEVNQWQRTEKELTVRLKQLATQTMNNNIQVTVDAEESERLALTLTVFENVFTDAAMNNWNGLGLAVQAYQKRALPVLSYLNELAKQHGKIIPLRLVKGAYWDSEIKHAQVQGLDDYPVFTRKCNTDASYLAAVQVLKKCKDTLFPQFATHNAHTVAYVKHFFKPNECEFQRLHGMGDTLYESLNNNSDKSYICRVYAPVGNHDTLLPYLVRRLLENGANTSFVHRIADPDIPVDTIIEDPVSRVINNKPQHRHSKIALPIELFGNKRKNSRGINFSDTQEVCALLKNIEQHNDTYFSAKAIVDNTNIRSKPIDIYSPADMTHEVGRITYANKRIIQLAINQADDAWPEWNETPADVRASTLEHAAELLQKNQSMLISLCIREAGKTIVDAHNELRETIDFCRYYAAECRRLFANADALSGPAGEKK